MKRQRHAIVVQLLDGEAGAEQERAIRTLTDNGMLSAALRTHLLKLVDRVDLDLPVQAQHASHVWASDGACVGATECLACGCRASSAQARVTCARVRAR